MVQKMVSLFGVWYTLERPAMKIWRGVKVPFIVRVRKHYETGSTVICNLCGPDFMKWAKQIR